MLRVVDGTPHIPHASFIATNPLDVSLNISRFCGTDALLPDAGILRSVHGIGFNSSGCQVADQVLIWNYPTTFSLVTSILMVLSDTDIVCNDFFDAQPGTYYFKVLQATAATFDNFVELVDKAKSHPYVIWNNRLYMSGSQIYGVAPFNGIYLTAPA